MGGAAQPANRARGDILGSVTSRAYQVRHQAARTLGCADTVAALTGRSRWSVRAHCAPGPEGYDVESCAATLADHDDPILLTASEAHRYLGVPAATVRSWAARGQLPSHDRNELGQPLYSAADVLTLAAARAVR